MPQSQKNRKKKKSTSKNAKASALLIAAAVLIAGVAFLLTRNGDSGASKAELLVRPDSYKLSSAATNDTFVEYLDFECESCGAAYPTIEELRKTYGDKVTFVVRYMPLHVNSLGAARAAEAAGAQGRFEDMYKKLFESQAQWAEKQNSQQSTFFQYATDLGLDMNKFSATYNDSAIIAKVERDKRDGIELGVTGTPTFFINGEKVTASSLDDFKKQLDEAIAQ